jgi:hypothetical protein
MGSLRAHRAPLASALLLASLCACGGEGAPPSASARVELGNVVIRAEIPAGKFGTLFLGAPRTQDRPPAPGTGSLGFEMDPMGSTSARAMATIDAAAPRPIETSIPFDAIPDGAYVFQWIVHDRAMSLMPIVAATPPIYVLHSGTSCETYGVASYVWRSHRNTWIALAACVALLGLLAWRRPFPPRILGIAAILAAAVAALVFVGMRALAEPDQESVDGGDHIPALYITPSWQLGGDADERVLGPGFRALVLAIRANKRPGEALYFHVYDESLADVPGARARASYLRREFPEGKIVFQHGDAGPGLSVYFGSPSHGEVLARGELGILARVEKETK